MGKSFSILCLDVGELIRGLTRARNLKKQYMYMQDFFLKTHFWFILISFPKFFPKFELPNSRCGLSASAAYTPVFTVPKLSFSRGREGALIWRGRLSLWRGANSKRGAYLKLGANLSIYGTIKASYLTASRRSTMWK